MKTRHNDYSFDKSLKVVALIITVVFMVVAL